MINVKSKLKKDRFYLDNHRRIWKVRNNKHWCFLRDDHTWAPSYEPHGYNTHLSEITLEEVLWNLIK